LPQFTNNKSATSLGARKGYGRPFDDSSE